MIKYALTAASFTGQVTFCYNAKGYLICFEVDGELTDEQHTWLLKKLPLTLDEMKLNISTIKSFNVVEVPMVVTFDMFWAKYDDCTRSSKKKTLQKWGKMPTGDQVKAFLFIDTYNRKRGSAEKKYATTYLNDELWNN